jgi:hypothetical protein
LLIIFYRHIENKHPEKLKGKSTHKRPNPFSDDEMSSPMKTRMTRSSARLTGAVDNTDEDDCSEVEGLPQSFTDEHYLNLTGMEKEYKVICLILFISKFLIGSTTILTHYK